jgi:alpha-ketoglutaric semialdehyde dehydrogenase
VEVVSAGSTMERGGANETSAFLFRVPAATFLAKPELQEELFGPATMLVVCSDEDEFRSVVEALPGTLTATVHSAAPDLELLTDLLPAIVGRAGRIVFNGMPTGVEVGHAMNHGGPYPATADARSTSVGSSAIYRFVRPVCYQDAPDHHLPAELKDGNPRGIMRLVDGTYTKEGVATS